jgi:hypothetical protein
MRKNDWATQFGAARRRIDRLILAEAERAIGLEEVKPIHETLSFMDEERKRIARAFGRPVK